jgi:hypothetical protein
MRPLAGVYRTALSISTADICPVLIGSPPGRQLVGDTHVEPDALGGCFHFEAFGFLPEDGCQIERLAGHLEFASVEAGDEEQVGEDRAHPLGLAQRVLHRFPVRLGKVAAKERHLSVRLDEGYGRFGFMGGVGDEGPLPLEGLARRTDGPTGHEQADDGSCAHVRVVALDLSPEMTGEAIGPVSMSPKRFLDWIAPLGHGTSSDLAG